MKTRILVLASILIVLLGMVFVFPIGISLESKACPDTTRCMINNAAKNANGPKSDIFIGRCSTAGGKSCSDCCPECQNLHPDQIIGSCGECASPEYWPLCD